MSEQAAQEPTMEEILASIRRIISEDEAPAEQPAPVAEAAPEPVAAPEPEPVEESPALMDETPSVEEDDVLELTQRYEPAPAPTEPAPVDTIGDIEATPFRAPEPAPEPIHTPSYEDTDALVRGRTADIASSAFSSFEDTVHQARAGGKTIEALAAELMKPMLQDWLDQNMRATLQEWFDQHLTEIVDRQVREELERIARRRR